LTSICASVGEMGVYKLKFQVTLGFRDEKLILLGKEGLNKRGRWARPLDFRSHKRRKMRRQRRAKKYIYKKLYLRLHIRLQTADRNKLARKHQYLVTIEPPEYKTICLMMVELSYDWAEGFATLGRDSTGFSYDALDDYFDNIKGRLDIVENIRRRIILTYPRIGFILENSKEPALRLLIIAACALTFNMFVFYGLFATILLVMWFIEPIAFRYIAVNIFVKLLLRRHVRIFHRNYISNLDWLGIDVLWRASKRAAKRNMYEPGSEKRKQMPDYWRY
jgi:hypothetical protein